MSDGLDSPAGYVDLSEIGRGGFAVVYCCRQSAMNRTVALKLLSSTQLDEQGLRRFGRECEAVGRLSWHPNVVVVHDAGVTPRGSPFLAMEFLDGGSLADRVHREGPLAWDVVLALGVQIADGLHAAHEAGILHRDVKPENVLTDRFGNAKITDFGIATVAGSAPTATGIVTGTLVHSAPEAVLGRRASVASDVYGLGSTLFQLLSGQAAFSQRDGESQASVLRRIVDEPVPELSARGVPAPIAALVSLLMAKDPAQRPPTAAAAGRALQSIQSAAGRPVTPMHLAEDGGLTSHVGATTAPVEQFGVATPGMIGDATTFFERARPPHLVGQEPPWPTAVPSSPDGRRNRSGLVAAAAVGLLALGLFVLAALAALGGLLGPTPSAEEDADIAAVGASPSSGSETDVAESDPTDPSPDTSAATTLPGGLSAAEYRLAKLPPAGVDPSRCDPLEDLPRGATVAIVCDLAAEGRSLILYRFSHRTYMDDNWRSRRLDSPRGRACTEGNFEAEIKNEGADEGQGNIRCHVYDDAAEINWTDRKHLVQLVLIGPTTTLVELERTRLPQAYTWRQIDDGK